MNNYREIDGDLIDLAKKGFFDVVAHGCNCQCIMGAGIAPQMAKAFACDEYPSESDDMVGEMNKLGTIDFESVWLVNEFVKFTPQVPAVKAQELVVVNAYTQFDVTGRKEGKIDLDYAALTLCLRKMNHYFRGAHIGLPRVGAGLAGGDWNIIKDIIQAELSDCSVTIVNYKQK